MINFSSICLLLNISCSLFLLLISEYLRFVIKFAGSLSDVRVWGVGLFGGDETQEREQLNEWIEVNWNQLRWKIWIWCGPFRRFPVKLNSRWKWLPFAMVFYENEIFFKNSQKKRARWQSLVDGMRWEIQRGFRRK